MDTALLDTWKVVGHFPDALARVVHGLMSDWKLLLVLVIINWKQKDAPEKT